MSVRTAFTRSTPRSGYELGLACASEERDSNGTPLCAQYLPDGNIGRNCSRRATTVRRLRA